MSSARSNLLSVAKKQYFFKLKACSVFFLSLVITQMLGIIFSLSGQGGRMSTHSGTYSVEISMLYSVPVFIFTVICAMACAIYLNAQEYKNVDFTFVSNRISGNISNIAFLITYAAIGAVTTGLSATFIRAAKLLMTGAENILETGFSITPIELACSIGSTFLYVLLFSSAAYLCAVLISKSKMFILLILAVVVLLPRTDGFKDLVKLITLENSFIMFMIKVIVISVICLGTSILLSNNLEVRR